MARKNPTIDKNPGTTDIGDGITVVNKKEALRQTMEMPDVSMKESNGDNPNISSTVQFANGKDNRNRTGKGPSNNPIPAMPGA